MHYSLIYLGSTELYEKIITDLNGIIHYSVSVDYIPFQLVVGRLFVEMSCCHSLIVDLNIQDWKSLCISNRKKVQSILDERILEVLQSLEEKEGWLGSKEIIDVYYSPDEQYISLYAVDPSKYADEGQLKTADGYPILRFRYKINEFDDPTKH